MSLRWIRNVLVSGEETTLEIFLGDREISDKCYIRINGGRENWFSPRGEQRHDILHQGIELLKKKYQDEQVVDTKGKPFTWN